MPPRVCLNLCGLVVLTCIAVNSQVLGAEPPAPDQAAPTKPPGNLPPPSASDDSSAAPVEFLKRTFQDEDGDHSYALYVPPDYSPDRQWPVVLFLHGASERGSDLSKPISVGLGGVIRDYWKRFPAIVIIPQCTDRSGRMLTCWLADEEEGSRALKILADVEQAYSIDPAHRILTGWSMGGYGTWSLAAAHPEMWSAVLPLAGGGDPATAPQLVKVPIWAFHGGKDVIVPPDESRKMVAAVEKAGGGITYSELPNVGHNIWPFVFASPAVVDWMLDPARHKPIADEILSKADASTPPYRVGGDFQPHIILPNAVVVRLGNDALNVLSTGVPDGVPPELLSGTLEDITRTLAAQGTEYRAQLSEIQYSTTLTSAHFEATRSGRLVVDLDLSKLSLTIGRTAITAPQQQVEVGPFRLVIGHRHPVHLRLTLQPLTEEGRLALRLVHSEFEIPDGNWVVERPEQIRVEGEGLTREYVETGLVGGLYQEKSEIESQVRSVAPSLVKGLQGQLGLTEGSLIAQSIWPLPVYRPLLKLAPQEVSVDEDGLTLTLQALAAVDGESAPQTPKVVSFHGVTGEDVPTSRDLEVCIAAGVLEPLSEMLIVHDIDNINVLDIPQGVFHEFGTRETLEEILPDLQRLPATCQFRSALVLGAPLTVDPPTPGTDAIPGQSINLVAPRLLLEVAIRNSSRERWRPCAVIAMRLSQPVTASLQAGETDAGIRLDWATAATIEVTGEYVDGYRPEDPAIDLSRARELLSENWSKWTRRSDAGLRVPDINVGSARLRLSDFEIDSHDLLAVFEPRPTVVINDSDQPFRYSVRSDNSRWGKPLELAPHGSHEFPMSRPLFIRVEGSPEQSAPRFGAGARVHAAPDTEGAWSVTAEAALVEAANGAAAPSTPQP